MNIVNFFELERKNPFMWHFLLMALEKKLNDNSYLPKDATKLEISFIVDGQEFDFVEAADRMNRMINVFTTESYQNGMQEGLNLLNEEIKNQVSEIINNAESEISCLLTGFSEKINSKVSPVWDKCQIKTEIKNQALGSSPTKKLKTNTKK